MTENGEPETAWDAKRAWPDILDVNELQEGKNPAWWRKVFPGADSVRMLGSRRNCWGWFWNAVFPRGFMLAEKTDDGWKWTRGCGGEALNDVQDWKGVEEFALREFVSGRLADTDPSGVGTFEGRLYLYWGLK